MGAEERVFSPQAACFGEVRMTTLYAPYNMCTGTDLLIPSSELHQLANLRLAHVFDAQLRP